METLILTLVVALILMHVAGRIIQWYLMRQILKDPKIIAAIGRLQQDLEKPPMTVRIEEHLGMFFLYDTDTHKFVVQGRSHDEIYERLKPMLDDRKIWVTEGDEDVIARFKATKNA
jgi:hypothetical protein